MTVTLSLAELLAVVLVAVTLASTNAAALSRLLLAWLAKRLGVAPKEVVAYDAATDGSDDSEP